MDIESRVSESDTLNSKLSIQFIKNNPFFSLYVFGFVIGSLVRILVSIVYTGMTHPDEVFQSIEMGHYLAFGYGYVPAEFQQTNPGIPEYARSRSWVLPFLISIMFRIGTFLHLDYYDGTLTLIHLTAAFNSILLIPAVYKLTTEVTENKKIGYLAGFMVAINWRLLYFSTRLLYNTVFLPEYFFGLYVVLKYLKSDHEIKARDSLIVIFCLGVVTYTRLDLLILLASFFLMIYLFRYQRQVKVYMTKWVKIGLLMLLGWILGMSLDFILYHSTSIVDFGTVPLQWFRFNIIKSYSDIFGLVPFGAYAYYLVYKPGLLLWVSSILIYYLIRLFKPSMFDFNEVIRTQRKNLDMTFLMLVLAWLIYESPWRSLPFFWESMSHKEERFVSNLSVLLLIILAQFIFMITYIVKEKGNNSSSVPKSRLKRPSFDLQTYLVFFLMVLFALTSIGSFYNPSTAPVTFNEGTNAALEHINRVAVNLKGVIIVEKWFWTGAFTYLHRNVSVFWVNFNEQFPLTAKSVFDSQFSSGYNYAVIPKYKLDLYPFYVKYLAEGGWVVDALVHSDTYVFRHP